ncbi:NAD-dependent DNA ligase LigA [Blattabacterium cuenoti]|uniref:NAD-dependent DNA ligase LigA n=1 Tax=Blattabacterium cuenoti TaxID=1653831 RepID=UPI00163C47F8|nr:NAD-dependent DNA ligase LigA [Blattabacterium cuenoti]
MTNKKIKEKIYRLRKELSILNKKYYNFSYSDISDFDFDKKLKKLYDLEKKYPECFDSSSPTLKIGSEIEQKKSKAINYKYKMYSINNSYSKEELKKWNNKIEKSINNFSFICEPKYDGVAINLIYKNGILIQAITRGNGEKGENVIRNIPIINSIPLRLIGNHYPSYIEIRGEIFIPIHHFEKMNQQRLKHGFKLYSNPRNTASGMLLNVQNKSYQKKILCCIAFHAVSTEFHINQYDSLQIMKYWGFNIPYHTRICKNIKEVFRLIDFWSHYQNKLSYQIDGIVIKINEYEKQSILGYTKKYPRWAIAYKFKQPYSETKLIGLTFQIGRTGIITPVANVDPTPMSGTTVKRVSLYNINFIKKNKIHYEDTFLLEKRGNVIPKITKINEQKRSVNAFPIPFIKKCPSCHSYLIKKKQLFYCMHGNCSSKIIMKLKHFVSDNAMNIKKIGYKMIEKLYNNGVLSHFHDFFQLKIEQLLQINGIKEKLAKTMIHNIHISKQKTPYHNVLYALGIRHVGEDISQKLTINFLDIHSLMNAKYNDLISIPGIGNQISKSIIHYFSVQENKKLIQVLIQLGLNFCSDFSMTKNKIHPIQGKYFVFTGKLSCMTRKKAKIIIESFGGIVFNNVNNQIDFIIVGNNYGSKLKKSIDKHHIKILTENHFLEMIEN